MGLKTIRFALTHEWVHIEGGLATVGISRFAVDQLSDLIDIALPPTGTLLKAGDRFGTVESVKAVSDLVVPIAGEVLQINEDVANDVQLLADDPYGRGWLIKLRVDDPAPIGQLMDLEAYEDLVAREAP